VIRDIGTYCHQFAAEQTRKVWTHHNLETGELQVGMPSDAVAVPVTVMLLTGTCVQAMLACLDYITSELWNSANRTDNRATFSAVGPLPRAAGDSAFAPGVKPANGTVAIAGASTFGFARKALRDGAAAAIKVYPIGLDDLLRQTGGPQPPYSVGDYGDKNIRNAPGTRFDIYRFPTIKQAKQFGKQNVPVMIRVPPGGHCPPGTIPRQR